MSEGRNVVVSDGRCFVTVLADNLESARRSHGVLLEAARVALEAIRMASEHTGAGPADDACARAYGMLADAISVAESK